MVMVIILIQVQQIKLKVNVFKLYSTRINLLRISMDHQVNSINIHYSHDGFEVEIHPHKLGDQRQIPPTTDRV